MSRRADHLRNAEDLLTGVDDGIRNFTGVFADASEEEIVAISTWFTALASVARAHTALAEHYALWEEDDDA